MFLYSSKKVRKKSNNCGLFLTTRRRRQCVVADLRRASTGQ